MSRGFAWAAFVAGLIAALALSVGAYLLATYSWDQVVGYVSPYAKEKLPAAEVPALPEGRASQVASTTVLVIVDGLREDASRRMESLNRLRGYGSDLTLVAPQPSLSYPDWTTLLSGAPPYVSGVTTNWFEGSVPVETLVDTAVRSDASLVVVGPEDLETLYRANRATAEFLRSYPTTEYASSQLVDEAIKLIGRVRPRLAIVHLPDVDNAGHRSGGDSKDYEETVAKVDVDLRRLIEGVQAEGVAFVITADHGHIDHGGHGGGEGAVTRVPGVFLGTGVSMGQGNALQEDVAATVAVLSGIPVPRHSKGDAITSVVATSTSAPGIREAWRQRLRFAESYVDLVLGPTGESASQTWVEGVHGEAITAFMDDADAARLAYDRRGRIWLGLAGLGGALLIVLAVGIASWRALVAALAGALVYGITYNFLYFGVHGYRWSLSAFNEETMVQAFFNGRMAEAALSGLIGVTAAAVVYPLLRRHPKPPQGRFLPGWLSLAPATVLVIMAGLLIQVSWFVWAWGIDPVWRLPDFRWALKYDLDLIQMTALSVAALLGPVVTYVVGRYHPRVRRSAA